MVENGKTAVVRYKGSFEDGVVFDRTDETAPFEFVVGSGNVVHGFDSAVHDMTVGESRTVCVTAHDAYGVYDESRIRQDPMFSLPGAQDLQVGKLFYFIIDEHIQFPAKILKIENGMATIDYNHPLAGKTLIYDIELLAIKD
jgi:peptidylprolyl isomerase